MLFLLKTDCIHIVGVQTGIYIKERAATKGNGCIDSRRLCLGQKDALEHNS